jgi:hypothetical protein
VLHVRLGFFCFIEMMQQSWSTRASAQRHGMQRPRCLFLHHHRARISHIRAQFATSDSKNAEAPVAQTRKSDSTDTRLKGFPSQLDRDIVGMAVPSLAAAVMDPLLGMVDTGTRHCTELHDSDSRAQRRLLSQVLAAGHNYHMTYWYTIFLVVEKNMQIVQERTQA